jgi:hypothetical protein
LIRLANACKIYEYTYSGKFNKIQVTVPSADPDVIMAVHLKAMNDHLNKLCGVTTSKEEVEKFIRKCSSDWTALTKTKWSIKCTLEKCYIWINKKSKLGPKLAKQDDNTKKNILDELLKLNTLSNNKLELGKPIDFGKVKPEDVQAFKQALIDLTTLEIVTLGKDDKVSTKISITGDITSECPLTGDKLITYHEKMSNMSIDIMKTYVQVFTQIIGFMVPWAGLQIPPDALKNLQELVKGFNTQKIETVQIEEKQTSK